MYEGFVEAHRSRWSRNTNASSLQKKKILSKVEFIISIDPAVADKQVFIISF